MIKTALKIIIVLQLIFLFLYSYRCLFEPGNHSGINFKFIGICSIILAGIIGFFVLKRKELFKLSIAVALLFGIIGIALITFDALNIMVEYNDWLKRGMPPKPF